MNIIKRILELQPDSQKLNLEINEKLANSVLTGSTLLNRDELIKNGDGWYYFGLNAQKNQGNHIVYIILESVGGIKCLSKRFNQDYKEITKKEFYEKGEEWLKNWKDRLTSVEIRAVMRDKEDSSSYVERCRTEFMISNFCSEAPTDGIREYLSHSCKDYFGGVIEAYTGDGLSITLNLQHKEVEITDDNIIADFSELVEEFEVAETQIEGNGKMYLALNIYKLKGSGTFGSSGYNNWCGSLIDENGEEMYMLSGSELDCLYHNLKWTYKEENKGE